MEKNKRALLDSAIADIEKKRKESEAHIYKSVEVVRKIDVRIEQQLKVLERLEAEKQAALDNVRDDFELFNRTYFTINDYEVKFHGKRPIEITDIQAFMRWLKGNIPAVEVAEFFGRALIKKELQKFIENYCDNQRSKGVIDPKVDGVNIGIINFRRLTTSLTKKEKRK